MALFVKQDFAPPILSRKWIAIKCRPNMLLQCRNHIISILESGLMFREDSAKVEQESPAAEEIWAVTGGGWTGWLTRGERVISLIGIAAALAMFPPKFYGSPRFTVMHITSYSAIPLCVRITHRLLARGCALNTLLAHMRQYLATARRTMACVKEYRLLHKGLGSVTTILESCTTLLYRQQTELSLLMARSSSAVLGNFPWLYEDVDWETLCSLQEEKTPNEADLVKVHHAFLVVQSTLLKHIAMAHLIQPVNIRKRYKNHNERIYWLHNDLIHNLNTDFKENFESLDRMYRLLRNFGTNDAGSMKKTVKIDDSWLYSDVHSEIARASIELKIAFNKCSNLDMLLDSCGVNKQKLDLNVLDKDLDELIDGVGKCLATVQSGQLRLKKIQAKFNPKNAIQSKNDIEAVVVENLENIIKIGDVEPESKDEVFYFVKTEDDDKKETAEDLITTPGQKERDTNKVVLVELKRKLVKREDMMRERERQALGDTMPELKGKIPEFPRQINVNEQTKGYIAKMNKIRDRKLFRTYKISHSDKNKGFFDKLVKLQRNEYTDLCDLKDYYEILTKNKRFVVSVDAKGQCFNVTKWIKNSKNDKKYTDSDGNKSSGLSEAFSDEKLECKQKTIVKDKKPYDAKNFTFSKKDLELSSESDYEEFQKEKKLLQDVRRNRVARRKNYPVKRGSVASANNDMDESLKPVEYSFGTGMAMASMLQVNLKANLGKFAQEEVFIGDGQVSCDSGNDEDA